MTKTSNQRAIIVASLILCSTLILSCFNLFPKEESPLCLISPIGENFRLEISSISTGATTEPALQIKKVQDGKIETLKVIPKYDAISGYSVTGSYIKLFVYDSLNSENMNDTISIKYK